MTLYYTRSKQILSKGCVVYVAGIWSEGFYSYLGRSNLKQSAEAILAGKH